MKYIAICVQGDVVEERYDESLTWMQDHVGGYIEYVYVDGMEIVCNEEGYNLPRNAKYPTLRGNIIEIHSV